jgi:hypothetical protein
MTPATCWYLTLAYGISCVVLRIIRPCEDIAMPFEHIASLTNIVISIIGLSIVILQLRIGNRQRESEALVKILDTNRHLLTLGFDRPEMFSILNDVKKVDPMAERYYLQLWLNQFSLVHSYLMNSMLRGELRDNLKRDVSDFMAMHNMRKHWNKYGRFYPSSFQDFVNGIMKEIEPPKAAHVGSGG